MNTFKQELENLEVEFLKGVPVKLPKSTVQAIVELVDREKEEFYKKGYIDGGISVMNDTQGTMSIDASSLSPEQRQKLGLNK